MFQITIIDDKFIIMILIKYLWRKLEYAIFSSWCTNNFYDRLTAVMISSLINLRVQWTGICSLFVSSVVRITVNFQARSCLLSWYAADYTLSEELKKEKFKSTIKKWPLKRDMVCISCDQDSDHCLQHSTSKIIKLVKYH